MLKIGNQLPHNSRAFISQKWWDLDVRTYQCFLCTFRPNNVHTKTKNQTKTLFRLPLCAITIDTAYQLAVLSLSFTLTTLLLLRPQTHDCKTGSAAADTAMPTRKWHSLWKRLFLCWGWELSQWQAANKHCLTDWMCSHNPASAGNASAERSQKWEHH